MVKLKEFLLINLGLLLVALSIYYIAVPQNLVTGGVSGLSIVINTIFPALSVGTVMLFLNLLLFIVGFIFIGFNFGAKTIYSSFALSGMVWLLEKIHPLSGTLTNDTLAEVLIASLLCSIGLAITFSQNASTGGTDIIAKILNKYFDIDLGKAVLAADILIVLSSIFVFDISAGMYGILGLLLNGLLIDYILQSLQSNKEIVIISRESNPIKDFIVTELDRGATIYSAKGAFTNNEREVIRTIVSRKQYIKLKRYIQSLDRDAFITVNNVSVTYGEGFINL
ncbi:YitT family protein [Clostridium thermarum]|uniref:YitT family protein n=1 Tax=Clostridium thermarum TaxID=1716543 RepID=UPI0013D4D72D|nr:YitT family protein [Clostridium thermarum]